MLFDHLVGKGKVIRPHGSPPQSGKFRVTQEFGCTGLVDEPAFKSCDHFHRGIDLGDLKCDSPVFAAQAGKVRFAGEVPVAGAPRPEKLVVLSHANGWGSSYGHLNSIDPAMQDGATVKAAQKIGTVGDTGNANGCHLHFAVKSGLPVGWTRSDFFPGSGDLTGRGRWRNPWNLLMQNVTIHPKAATAINIRTAPDLDPASKFARTAADGTIRRIADNADLGKIATPCRYGGTVKGAEYEMPDGRRRTDWDKIELDGAFRFVAGGFAVRSAR
jgi:murein DD-endopeptidase MepM/ murein hydrolase activator NlpD